MAQKECCRQNGARGDRHRRRRHVGQSLHLSRYRGGCKKQKAERGVRN